MTPHKKFGKEIAGRIADMESIGAEIAELMPAGITTRAEFFRMIHEMFPGLEFVIAGSAREAYESIHGQAFPKEEQT